MSTSSENQVQPRRQRVRPSCRPVTGTNDKGQGPVVALAFQGWQECPEDFPGAERGPGGKPRVALYRVMEDVRFDHDSLPTIRRGESLDYFAGSTVMLAGLATMATPFKIMADECQVAMKAAADLYADGVRDRDAFLLEEAAELLMHALLLVKQRKLDISASPEGVVQT